MILVVRTDNPLAEIGLYDKKGNKIGYKSWEAHRELSSTLHVVIAELLGDRDWKEIEGVIFYKGPGSFTGLRIGASLINALAASNSVPVVNINGENWILDGITQLEGASGSLAIPEYGSEPHITAQKK